MIGASEKSTSASTDAPTGVGNRRTTHPAPLPAAPAPFSEAFPAIINIAASQLDARIAGGRTAGADHRFGGLRQAQDHHAQDGGRDVGAQLEQTAAGQHFVTGDVTTGAAFVIRHVESPMDLRP